MLEVLFSEELKETGVSSTAVLAIEIEREDDGRWLAEIPAIPGVLAYGVTSEEARARAEALALRVMADRREHGEPVPHIAGLFEAVA